MMAKPDTIYITLHISGDGMLTEDAVKSVDAKSNEIRNVLASTFPKLKEVAITTVKLGEKSSRGYRPDMAEPPRPEAINRLTITMDIGAADDISKIIDTALRAGAMLQVASHAQFAGDLGSVVRYGIADAKKLEADVWSQALKEANQKAAELAKLAGGTIGDLVSIGEESGSIYDYNFARMSRGGLLARHLSFSNDPIEIGSNLRVTFELKK